MYEPFGPLTSLTFGNGLKLTRQYDQNYRLTAITTGSPTASLQNLTYGYDARNAITSIADAGPHGVNQAFTYDALDRLTNATGAYGTRTYGYDADDNRVSQTANGVSSSYSYASTSNELTSVTTGNTNRTLGYTVNGNVASDSQAGNAYTYNARNRPSILSIKGVPSADYSYDATGMRVSKRLTTASRTVTHFHYDFSGHLLAETEDSQGGTLREYIWLDDLPVTQLDATGKISYLHTDHLGTPLLISNSAQGIDWQRIQTPYGEDFSQTGTNTSLLRMPGQYYDAESGQYYNAMRNYDPTSGRYLQTDPIGLNGGLNTYAYAGGNPVNKIDPEGLYPNPMEVTCVDPLQPACWVGAVVDVGQDIWSIYKAVNILGHF